MKNKVDIHRCEELEPICLEADFLSDGKGSDVLPIEFLTRSLNA